MMLDSCRRRWFSRYFAFFDAVTLRRRAPFSPYDFLPQMPMLSACFA